MNESLLHRVQPRSVAPPQKSSNQTQGPGWAIVSFGRRRQIILVAAMTGVAAPVLIAVLPTPMAIAATLGVFCIGMWSTGAVPEYWPALAFFAAAIILRAAPTETVLSGFHSSTFWLLFGGMVLGHSIRHTGLGQRAAGLLAGLLGRRYAGVIAGTVLFSLALAFIMPSSMGRIVLLVPIVASLADRMGYGERSNGRTGMLVAAAFATCLPAYAILPANTPNMILAGAAEGLYGHRISYWNYLLLHFPVLGAAKVALLAVLVLWMFPDRDPVRNAAAEGPSPPISRSERHLIVVLGLCLILWLTDGLHHVSPGWVALAAALYCLWPRSGLAADNCINQEINYATLLFVAGILGLGAVTSSTGLGSTIVDSLSEHARLESDRPVRNVAALTIIATAVALVTNLPGVPAVMTPGAESLAVATGLPLATVLMTQVLAFSNILLPYQAPPLVSAVQIAKLPVGAVTRLCMILFAATVLILMPLDLLWWHFLGLM